MTSTSHRHHYIRAEHGPLGTCSVIVEIEGIPQRTGETEIVYTSRGKFEASVLTPPPIKKETFTHIGEGPYSWKWTDQAIEAACVRIDAACDAQVSA